MISPIASVMWFPTGNYEPKDIADIWVIARNKRFSWKTALNDAKEKDAGLEPLAVVEILKTFPGKKIHAINWVARPDERMFLSDLSEIGDDIFKGGNNRLAA